MSAVSFRPSASTPDWKPSPPHGRVTVGAVTPNSETETRSSVLSERRERLSGRFYFNQFVEVVGNSTPEVLDVEPSRSHGCQVMLHVQVEEVVR